MVGPPEPPRTGYGQRQAGEGQGDPGRAKDMTEIHGLFEDAFSG